MNGQMRIENDWPLIKALFRDSFASSLYYAIGTINEDGTPHVTPIGSLILGEPGSGYYFEEFPSRLSRNLATNPNLTVLAVNSGRWFWVRSLFRGSFPEQPAIRLTGIAGNRREATREEIARWQRRVRLFRRTSGYRQLWEGMHTVREIRFTGILPIDLGSMTAQASDKASHRRHES